MIVKYSAESKGNQITAMPHEHTDLIQDMNLPSCQQPTCHHSTTSPTALFQNTTFLNTNPEETQFYRETFSLHLSLQH